ncbi:uncharacterized protein LOC134017543 [Osmerus eperlanus]|uniref:uncharacterized protein LOC134017543 n=1 Tax=Osmerus eperlanus TaxID=29151 RepID=UPI002E0FF516
MEIPSFRRARNGDQVLRATPEAQSIPKPLPGARVLTAEEVEAEARAHVVSQGGDPGTARLVLSQHRLQFGKYWGRSFKWLLENDVGYTLPLLNSHLRERERTSSQSALSPTRRRPGVGGQAGVCHGHVIGRGQHQQRPHLLCRPAPVPAQEKGAPGLGRLSVPEAADHSESPGAAGQHAQGHQACSSTRSGGSCRVPQRMLRATQSPCWTTPLFSWTASLQP